MLSIKTRNTIMTLVVALVASFSIAGAAIVPTATQAQPVGAEGSGKTKKDLEADGYTCEVVSEGFQECTKSGSPTYWCSGDTCEVAPARGSGGRRPSNVYVGPKLTLAAPGLQAPPLQPSSASTVSSSTLAAK